MTDYIRGFSKTAAMAAGRRPLFVLAVVSGLVYWAGRAESIPFVNAEERCAEISQHMVETGDLLVPQLDGRPHLTKPPLLHWLSWVVARLTRQSGLPAVRAVSALAAVGVVLLSFRLGSQLYSRSVGWWAAALTLTNTGLLEHGHRGSFDALVAACVLFTLHGYLLHVEGKTRSGQALMVCGMVLGFLSKGPIGWIIPLLAMGGDAYWRAEGRAALRRLACWSPVILAASLGWYAYLLVVVPDARGVLQDVITVNFGVRDAGVHMAFHDESFYYYAWALPVFLSPWLVVLLPCFIKTVRADRAAWFQRNRFALVWLVTNVIFLSCIPAKGSRYLLPLVPAFGLLAGDALCQPWASARALWFSRTWVRTIGVFMVVVCMTTFPLWLWVRIGESPAMCLLTALLAAGSLSFGLLVTWSQDATRLVATLAIWLALMALPAYQRWLPVHTLVHRRPEQAEGRLYEQRRQRLRGWFRPSQAAASEGFERTPGKGLRPGAAVPSPRLRELS